jgi:uncharacterized integral membrane protein (TIGR00701 family)
MAYLWFKSFHIVAFVAWFAGLFYLPRLFVYHVEANEQPEAVRTVLKDGASPLQHHYDPRHGRDDHHGDRHVKPCP